MGNEGSREEEVPFGPPETLKARTLDALVEYINSGEARKIVLMVYFFSIPSFLYFT